MKAKRLQYNGIQSSSSDEINLRASSSCTFIRNEGLPNKLLKSGQTTSAPLARQSQHTHAINKPKPTSSGLLGPSAVAEPSTSEQLCPHLGVNMPTCVKDIRGSVASCLSSNVSGAGGCVDGGGDNDVGVGCGGLFGYDFGCNDNSSGVGDGGDGDLEDDNSIGVGSEGLFENDCGCDFGCDANASGDGGGGDGGSVGVGVGCKGLFGDDCGCDFGCDANASRDGGSEDGGNDNDNGVGVGCEDDGGNGGRESGGGEDDNNVGVGSEGLFGVYCGCDFGCDDNASAVGDCGDGGGEGG
ncbi:unnamed protein product [Protopolystoma xenopodis]|uniref:Uncharacterized protein n=1 Tax=Protopolystoma xenopodis TaxID=117903 RepID=A0A448XFH1_9PLAT|nr:unnamed protein product [Protopolystoma xenopodis]